jgi:hypothetical protein
MGRRYERSEKNVLRQSETGPRIRHVGLVLVKPNQFWKNPTCPEQRDTNHLRSTSVNRMESITGLQPMEDRQTGRVLQQAEKFKRLTGTRCTKESRMTVKAESNDLTLSLWLREKSVNTRCWLTRSVTDGKSSLSTMEKNRAPRTDMGYTRHRGQAAADFSPKENHCS